MTFEDAVSIILDLEKGYVNDPDDPGGETNFGISKRQYPGYNIKTLTRAEAIAIYHEDYWQPLKPLLLPDQIRLCMLDAAVNQGVTQAIKMLQTSVGAAPDGVLGPYTLSAVQKTTSFKVLDALLHTRLNHYSRLPTWPKFGVGWMSRLLTIALFSVK